MEQEAFVTVDSSEDEAPPAPPGTQEEEPQEPQTGDTTTTTAMEEEEEDAGACMDFDQLKDPLYSYRGLSICEAAVEAEEANDATPFVFGLLEDTSIAKLLLDDPNVKGTLNIGQEIDASRIASKAPSGLLMSKRSVVGWLIQRQNSVDMDLGIANGKLGGPVYDLLGRNEWTGWVCRSILVEGGEVVGLTKGFKPANLGKEGLDILRVRRKKCKESRVTRALYSVEDREGNLLSPRIYIEMATDGEPKPWSSSSGRHSLQGNLAKRMRVSVKADLTKKQFNASP